MILFGAVIFASFILTSCGGGKPSDYKLINKENIPYVKDPWNGFVGFKHGEVIGIVLRVGRSGTLSIPFNYFAENCWGNTNRKGELVFNIDQSIPSELNGKECLIIGTVEEISIKTPTNACDDTYGSVQLKSAFIELYDPNKLSKSSKDDLKGEYVVGPEYKSNTDLFGTYCDDDCYFYILLGDVNKLQTDLNGVSQEIIEYAKKESWDGYSFINKGGGVTGIGFWKIKALSPIAQNNNYPIKTAGEKFNGAEINIKWMPSGMGLEIYPDGIYQIRNSPYGIDWSDEQSSEQYRVFLLGTDGFVKFQKKK